MDGAAASWGLFKRAVEAQAAAPDPELIRNGELSGMRHTTRAIELYGKASLWDFNETAGRSVLGDLEPATPTAVTASREFESSLAALRALRQLSFRQRIGDDRASAASLNDLARLAIVATEPDCSWLPRPTSPSRASPARGRTGPPGPRQRDLGRGIQRAHLHRPQPHPRRIAVRTRDQPTPG